MTETISIRAPGLFHISDGGARILYGANQIWYSTEWKRKSGCGPTTCAQIMWYLSREREGCVNLCCHDGTHKAGFIRLMEDMWDYVTPGMGGVNNTAIFLEGAVRYGKDRGVKLSGRVLETPVIPAQRPSAERLADFLSRAFADDLPVAFLNLSNGALKNLESWHWVTLFALDRDKMTALMADQSVCREIELGLWLRTTCFGGGFVVLEPD